MVQDKMNNKMTDNLVVKDFIIYLTKHSCLSINSYYSPTKNSESINHCSVRISPHNTIRINYAICVENDSPKIFKIYLH
jgi:hypothetical protein